MKIIHINTSSSHGGAAIAAYRHTEAMYRAGVSAKLLAKKGDNLPLAKVLGNRRGDRLLEYAQFKALELMRLPYHPFSFMTRNYGIRHISDVQEADVVYLHWVNNFLGYDDIDWLLAHKKRVVWYMHDMWPMTGGCHYALSCKKYLTDCKQCPQLKSTKWLPSRQLEKKIRLWRDARSLIVATPSRWLADRARESALFDGHDIVVCPNVIDTNLYTPTTDKTRSKQKLGLDSGKKYVLFGAAVGAKNIFKGMSYLYEALQRISQNYEYIAIGRIGEDYPEELKSRTHEMGFVTNEQQKVAIYQAADVFVIPSIAENFPNMVVESMACGVPAVGFSIGGVVEQILHKERGYLCDDTCAESLAEGIEWVLNNDAVDKLSFNCRTYVQQHCSYDSVINNHNSLLNI